MENSKGDMEERCHSAKETAHDFEEVDPNREYYRLYRKLYSESLKLKQQFSGVENKEQRLNQRVAYLSDRSERFKDYICQLEGKRKKFERRGSDQIHKQFVCQADRCKHAYGSETAFRRHLKIKHPEQYNPKKRGRTWNSSEVINGVIQL